MKICTIAAFYRWLLAFSLMTIFPMVYIFLLGPADSCLCHCCHWLAEGSTRLKSNFNTAFALQQSYQRLTLDSLLIRPLMNGDDANK